MLPPAADKKLKPHQLRTQKLPAASRAAYARDLDTHGAGIQTVEYAGREAGVRRLPAIPLIVGRRNIPTVAAFSQTNSRETSRFPRRTRFVGVMFIEFHRRSCSHWIRPNGCPEPFGHFFLKGPTLGHFTRRNPGSYPRTCDKIPRVPPARELQASAAVLAWHEGNSGK
ncbi:MAG: hypothetical protein RLZZ436_4574 [Planctomycetota bacterium]